MPTKEIYDLIKEAVGLDVSSVGEETVRRIVLSRMNSVGCQSPFQYLDVLNGSPEERQNLINDITVPETWFFRDQKPFELLADYSANQWSPEYFGKKFQALSIPCATGEEPYSIAMTLLDAGFSKDDFQIDAADISTRVLALAKTGVYGRNSFRGECQTCRDRFFEEKNGLFKISNEVKSTVSFHHQNILSPKLMDGFGPYDVIFCRNLLIYFDMDTKKKVLSKLGKLLASDGILFLGHAETGRGVFGQFESLRQPGTFAYRKTEGQSPSLQAPEESNVVAFPKAAPKSERVAHSPSRAHQPETKHKRPALSQIQEMADKGLLDQARDECCSYLETNPEDVECNYLLGVVNQALGKSDEAVVSYKRALYLEPTHYQALLHLAMMCEERGDMQAAKNYRARIERLNDSQDKDS